MCLLCKCATGGTQLQLRSRPNLKEALRWLTPLLLANWRLLYTHKHMLLPPLHTAGGTQLQLPSWTTFKEALRRLNWTSLQRLSLPSMNLTGPIGPLAYHMPQLALLDLSSNQLSGVLPPDLSGAYSGLLHVNLSSNALYGE